MPQISITKKSDIQEARRFDFGRVKIVLQTGSTALRDYGASGINK